MHRIETDPEIERIQNHLRELATVPGIGDSHPSLSLHIVVSYDKTSGTISDDKITKHETSLRSQMESLNKNQSKWQVSMHEVHFEGEPEVALRAVENLFRTDLYGSSL